MHNYFYLCTLKMKYNTLTLPCGLRLIHLPAPGQQVTYCGYAIAAGTRHEMPGE